MAALRRLSSSLLSAETASFARQSVSSLRRASPPRSADFFRSFAAAATPKPAASAKPAVPKSPTGIMKPLPISPAMQKFLGGVSEAPRTRALKEIWAHIKQNNLQDPANKKIIICDEKLKSIFAGKEQVGFLEIAGLISPHFLKVKSP